jgi:hypothetical protein
MVWVPSNKVHARLVISKHDKTMESGKSDRSSGDYGGGSEITYRWSVDCDYLKVQEGPWGGARRLDL